jgi:ubiquinone biosynthesis accessory factor UbiJ
MKNAPPVFSSGAASGSPSPLGFLQSLLGSIRPPDWVVDELQNRVVLFLNHVLMQEPQAQERLKRQKGKPVKLQWGDVHLTLAATPAGLLERPTGAVTPELTVTLTQTSPFAVAQSVIAGDKPGVDIQGDVQLAAEVAWLVDNVRWDVEEDLSRVVGDATAHTLSRFARAASQAVKAFVARLPEGFPPRPAAPPVAPADSAGSPGSGGNPA